MFKMLTLQYRLHNIIINKLFIILLIKFVNSIKGNMNTTKINIFIYINIYIYICRYINVYIYIYIYIYIYVYIYIIYKYICNI